MTELAALQIQHYKQGTGLIVNIHITHHGGTTVCRAIGHSPNGTAPSRACNRPTENDGDNIPFPDRNPWLHAQTADNIKLLRENFHMIGMEFGYIGHVPKPSLAVTDWEHPDLVSMIVMRHPVSRLLARSGWIHNHYPDIPKGNASQTDWWEYAKHPWFTNNYALRVLAGHECCDGANTSREHLQQAKAPGPTIFNRVGYSVSRSRSGGSVQVTQYKSQPTKHAAETSTGSVVARPSGIQGCVRVSSGKESTGY